MCAHACVRACVYVGVWVCIHACDYSVYCLFVHILICVHIYLVVSILKTNVIVNDLLSVVTMVFCIYSLHHFVRQQEAERVHRENLVSAAHGSLCVDWM